MTIRMFSLRGLFSLLVVFILLACGGDQATSTSTVEDDANSFGDGIRNAQFVDFKAVIDGLQTQDTVYTTFTATVDEVCQAKGCWMTLYDGTNTDVELMVRFKDYGFFVPKDIGGRKVIVEGKAFKKVTPVEELRHYAEDAGRSAEEIEQITEPEQTYSFEATGVKVL